MSIHYEFPVIEHIDDVLPHIDDKSFKVIAKDCGNTYINYVRMGSETFPPVLGSEAERLAARVRRECRGIAFNTETGKLVSRPFHKFFNVGETEHLTFEHLGFHREHVVMDKMDGSMLRPIPTPFGLRWGTKMGITDVGNLAETWIEQHDKYRKFALRMMAAGRTPIFEFVSPENRIVARYAEPNMVLLAVRHNTAGTYMSSDTMRVLAEEYGIPVVKHFDPVEGDPETYFELIRASDDLDEGIVIAWSNGHRAKAKTDQYTTLHKIKEKASTERNLILAILEQEVDDLLPLVPEEEAAGIMGFADEFWGWVDSLADDIGGLHEYARATYQSKKDFAVATQDWERVSRSCVFTLWDGKEDTPRDLALSMIRTGLTSETKWAQFRESLGGATRLQKPTMVWHDKEGNE